MTPQEQFLVTCLCSGRFGNQVCSAEMGIVLESLWTLRGFVVDLSVGLGLRRGRLRRCWARSSLRTDST